MNKIKFGTDGWRAIIAESYTVENLSRVTEATAIWLKKHYESPTVMIGYDCRFHGKYFSQHAANVFAQNGIGVFISQSYVSTPMVSMATNKRQSSAGIVITASHNPPEYSGFKIKGDFGGPATPDMIAEVEANIPDKAAHYEDRFDELVEERKIQYFDAEAVYLNHIKNEFDLEAIKKSGIKVGYDAMYGAGQNVIRKLLPDAELVHCEFNPSFHGTAPEPIEKNLGEFQQIIKDKGIQFGLATDGDADRIGLFDEEGGFVDSHHIILLLIQYLHKHKGLKGKVVSTVSCTTKIAKMCELYGLQNDVTKVGFKYICEIMLKEDVLVGGEESGGIAAKGHIPERDGIYIGLIILEMMAKTGKKLTELVQEIYDIVGSFYYQRNDLHLPNPQKEAVIKFASEEKGFETMGGLEILRVETIDGVKYHLPNDQWVLMRASGTEPVLRIYAESKDKKHTLELLDSAVHQILEKGKELVYG